MRYMKDLMVLAITPSQLPMTHVMFGTSEVLQIAQTNQSNILA